MNPKLSRYFWEGFLPSHMDRRFQEIRLVFISSTLSESPAPSFIAHGSAKGALDSFSKYLAQELGPYGITSNIVAPGLVLTDATKDAPEEFKEMIRVHTPTQRIAVPEDVANAVRFLASENSGHITGTSTPVCGGAYLPSLSSLKKQYHAFMPKHGIQVNAIDS